METDGASNNERLLAAARSDNQELLLEIFDEGDFDINVQDGLGNTALHYAASGSTDVLDHILACENCDVDIPNRIEGSTPLHLAAKLENEDMQNYIVESLLDAGADTTIKDKNGDTPEDLLPANSPLRILMRKARAQSSVADDDIASDDEGFEGAGSGSDDE